jgi:hypothetical protein
VAVSCELGKEPSDSIECGESSLAEELLTYQERLCCMELVV